MHASARVSLYGLQASSNKVLLVLRIHSEWSRMSVPFSRSTPSQHSDAAPYGCLLEASCVEQDPFEELGFMPAAAFADPSCLKHRSQHCRNVEDVAQGMHNYFNLEALDISCVLLWCGFIFLSHSTFATPIPQINFNDYVTCGFACLK